MPSRYKRIVSPGIFPASIVVIAMKQPRRILAATAGCVLLTGALLVPAIATAQELLPPPNTIQPARQAVPAAAPVPVRPAPAPQQPSAEDAAIVALAAEVLQQQAKLAENQKAIDEKLAVIAENLRIARIYVSRVK